MIEFDRHVCGNFATAIQKEWIETNGIGGYTSSSIIGTTTRCHHRATSIPALSIHRGIDFYKPY